MAGKKNKQRQPDPQPKVTNNIVKEAIAELTSDADLFDLSRAPAPAEDDPRYADLNKKEAYLRGTAYDERPFDWSGYLVNAAGLAVMRAKHGWYPSNDETPPSFARRPSTQYNMVKVGGSRFATMLMGKKRFPFSAVPKDPDTQLWCNQVMAKAEFQPHFSEATVLGGAVGSVIVMYKVVDGAFQLEVFNTKLCNIAWRNFNDGSMEAFCTSYPYVKQVFNTEHQRWESKLFLYRRIVTENFDIEFLPQELIVSGKGYRVKNGEGELPQPNPDKTIRHNLGRCPARFIQNLPRYDQIDGDTLFEGVYDKIDRINENLSAINSALQGNLDPTLVLKMTPDDYNRLEESGGPIKTGNDGFAVVVGEKGDAKYIEVQCASIEVAMKIMDLMRNWALEEADCVIADPHKISGAAQSDSAISKLYTPMLAKCDSLRTQYGDRGIRKLLADMIRAYHVLTHPRLAEDGIVKPTLKPIEVIDPASKQIRTVVPKENIDHDDIVLVWGRYFEPSANDVFQVTEAAVMAAGGKAVTTQTQAARFVAEYFNDPSIETTVVELEKQAKEDAELVAKGLKEAAKTQSSARPPSTRNRQEVKGTENA